MSVRYVQHYRSIVAAANELYFSVYGDEVPASIQPLRFAVYLGLPVYASVFKDPSVTAIIDSTGRIYVNRFLEPAMQNHGIAHVIAHCLFHNPCTDLVRTLRQSLRSEREIQAEIFAATLLIRDEHISVGWKRFRGNFDGNFDMLRQALVVPGELLLFRFAMSRLCPP